MKILFWTTSNHTNNQPKSRRGMFVIFTTRDYTSVCNSKCKYGWILKYGGHFQILLCHLGHVRHHFRVHLSMGRRPQGGDAWVDSPHIGPGVDITTRIMHIVLGITLEGKSFVSIAIFVWKRDDCPRFRTCS